MAGLANSQRPPRLGPRVARPGLPGNRKSQACESTSPYMANERLINDNMLYADAFIIRFIYNHSWAIALADQMAAQFRAQP